MSIKSVILYDYEAMKPDLGGGSNDVDRDGEGEFSNWSTVTVMPLPSSTTSDSPAQVEGWPSDDFSNILSTMQSFNALDYTFQISVIASHLINTNNQLIITSFNWNIT